MPRAIKNDARVRYIGPHREGVWTGREGVAFSVDEETKTALIRWDEPEPKPICFVSHSGCALAHLEAL